MLVAKVKVVISDGVLQLYFIKYNLAGITELLLVLRGSDIWITYPRNLTQVRCHSWKKWSWLYLLCGEELVAWEQPRPIYFFRKTHILCHSLRVLLVTCLLLKVKFILQVLFWSVIESWGLFRAQPSERLTPSVTSTVRAPSTFAVLVSSLRRA